MSGRGGETIADSLSEYLQTTAGLAEDVIWRMDVKSEGRCVCFGGVMVFKRMFVALPRSRGEFRFDVWKATASLAPD